MNRMSNRQNQLPSRDYPFSDKIENDEIKTIRNTFMKVKITLNLFDACSHDTVIGQLCIYFKIIAA